VRDTLCLLENQKNTRTQALSAYLDIVVEKRDTFDTRYAISNRTKDNHERLVARDFLKFLSNHAERRSLLPSRWIIRTLRIMEKLDIFSSETHRVIFGSR